MKLKSFIFLVAMMLVMGLYEKVQAETKVVTLFQEEFNVPGPGKHKATQIGDGIEKPFTLDHKATVDMTILTNKQKPSLNVFLLDSDNYAKYQQSGSLTNLTTIPAFSKSETLAFKSTGDLEAGKYVLIIKWAHTGLFYTAPAVGLKMIAQENIYVASVPTPTPKGFWSNVFGGK